MTKSEILARDKYCEQCNTLVECDCSTIETTRFKDLILNCSDCDRTFTIYVGHCAECGDIKYINY